MAYERIVALYDNTSKAKDAARALENSGFSTSDISVLNRDSFSDKDMRDGNLWQRLFGRAISDKETATYNRTVQSGGALLSLRTAETEVGRAMEILDVHKAADVDDASARASSSSPSTARSANMAAANPPAGTLRADEREEVLRLAEEQLDVGKRQVETGRARIRRFVVEKPVESQITLHEEHTEISRRAATDPALARDIDWKDRTIEIVETSEQPVVSKTARVSEEIVIRKRGSDHVEVVRDTVRQQHVEVERAPRETKDTRGDVKKAA